MAEGNNFDIGNERMETLLNELSRRIKVNLPPGWGFTLFLFNFGEKGAMFYSSSAQRADMILALEEFISKQKSYGNSDGKKDDRPDSGSQSGV